MTKEQRNRAYSALPIAFNINWNVRVRLTDHGRAYLRRTDRASVLEREVDGWTAWQLHDLMNTFGSQIGMGFSVPFETTIELIGDPLEVAMRNTHAAATS
jgi:hypothetical protein